MRNDFAAKLSSLLELLDEHEALDSLDDIDTAMAFPHPLDLKRSKD